jgi:hypothetical protein
LEEIKKMENKFSGYFDKLMGQILGYMNKE